MPTYDIFETEHLSTYSGSYNSRVMYGSYFSSASAYNRTVIADEITGLVSSSFYAQEIIYQQSTALYLKSGSYLGRNPNILSMQSDGELFYDSLMINPLLYTIVNGASPVGVSPAISGSTNFNIPDVPASGAAVIHIAASGTQATTADGTIFTDGRWLYAFPFESSYRNLPRSLQQSYNTLSPITTTVSTSIYGPFITYTGDAKYTFRNVSQISNIQMWPGLNGAIATELFDGAFVSGTATWNEDSFPQNGQGIMVRDECWRPSIAQLNRCYFGIGHGHHGLVTTGHFHILASSYGFLIAPILKGWKYGVYNGSPVTSKAVFRLNRFGHMRDMLEQRPFTKFFDQTTGKTVTSPVEVRAVSGSAFHAQTIDYLTATNPSYNPRDSGAWDYEYRSGQPFSDDGGAGAASEFLPE